MKTSAATLPSQPIPKEIVDGVLFLAHRSAARHWVPATSGNFSVRIDAKHCAITVSGGDKAELSSSGVIWAAIEGPTNPRASAEAPLHYLMYRLSPEIGSVAHVHASSAVLASLRCAKNHTVTLEGLELLKAFRGIKTHDSRLDVPVFENDQDMDALSRRVQSRLTDEGTGWGFLLAGHGLYVWGRDAIETFRHLEAFDYLFSLALQLKGSST